MLETYLRERLKEKEILLMTHIVLGYPSFEEAFKVIEAMVEGGVDLVELQIPFSEPIADGPVILRANQEALGRGIKVDACLEFAGKVARTFDIPFLVMSYYNILFKRGVASFVAAMAQNGLRGAIVADLPLEEGEEYVRAMETQGLSPIFLFSPTTSLERMQAIASSAKGFVYCVARKGVTGAETRFSEDLTAYLDRCRQATSLPLALGFGVRGESDVDFLKGKADIAVVGSQVIRVLDEQGIPGVRSFIRRLSAVCSP